jgi:MFS family permease
MLLSRNCSLTITSHTAVFSTMVGGILADIYVASERNTPMVIFVGMTLFGTGLGPLVSDFVAQNTSWRWVYYIQTITCGLLIAAVALFFKETRGSILLSRKAKALNKWYEELEAAGYIGLEMPLPQSYKASEKPPCLQRIRWKVKSDEDRASLAKMISISLTRPFHMLFTESVVFWFSLWVSFSWAILYLQFGAIPLVFRVSHNFDLQQTGAIFAAVMVGGIVSTALSIYQEKLALRYFPEKVSATPEGRLYFACVESALMPIGLFWFGWTSYSDIHWIVPAIAVAVATMGIFSIYLATFNYLADIYHRYASSAIAAQSMCRNLLGGAFPLVTVQMYTRLGFPGASSLLGGLAVALTAVPWVLLLYGPRIRARSPFAREIMI